MSAPDRPDRPPRSAGGTDSPTEAISAVGRSAAWGRGSGWDPDDEDGYDARRVRDYEREGLRPAGAPSRDERRAEPRSTGRGFADYAADRSPSSPPPPVQHEAPPEPSSSAPYQQSRPPRTPAPAISRTRRARLKVVRVDPWSVMKLAFILSIALGIITFIAVAVLWSVLDAMGVFSSVGATVSDVTGAGEGTNDFNLQEYLSLSRVLGFTTLVAVVDVVLITALATLTAFLYNLASSFAGGLEVTLGEEN